MPPVTFCCQRTAAQDAGEGPPPGAASSHYGEVRTLAAGHAFVAAEQPDVPCPERDLLTRWMALAAEYVSHRHDPAWDKVLGTRGEP